MAADRGDAGAVEGARIALSTGSLHNWALDRVFELAASAGYDGVELLVDARMESSDAAYLQRLSERWDIPILSVHTPFVPRVEGWSEAPAERVVQAVRLAGAVGASTVVAHLPLRWEIGRIHLSLGRWRFERLLIAPWRSAAGSRYGRWLLEDLPALQERWRVRVALENMPAHRVWGRRMQLHSLASLQALSRFPFVALDTTHWGTWGVEPLQVYRALRQCIAHVHLSDYDGREHRLPGKGHLQLGELLAEMGRDGFRGIVVLEVEPSAIAEAGWSLEQVQCTLAQVRAGVRAMLAPSHSHTDLQAPPDSATRRVA